MGARTQSVIIHILLFHSRRYRDVQDIFKFLLKFKWPPHVDLLFIILRAQQLKHVLWRGML